MTSAAAAVGGGRGGRERENPSLFPPCAPRGPSAAHTRAQARLPQAVTDPALTRGSARRGRRPRPAHWFSSMALRDRPCSAAPRLGACSAHGHRAARLGETLSLSLSVTGTAQRDRAVRRLWPEGVLAWVLAAGECGWWLRLENVWLLQLLRALPDRPRHWLGLSPGPFVTPSESPARSLPRPRATAGQATEHNFELCRLAARPDGGLQSRPG